MSLLNKTYHSNAVSTAFFCLKKFEYHFRDIKLCIMKEKMKKLLNFLALWCIINLLKMGGSYGTGKQKISAFARVTYFGIL